MRFSLFTVFTLSGLVATTLANPLPVDSSALHTRGIAEEASTLDDLQDTIKELTSKISMFRPLVLLSIHRVAT
jgi:hypothetical protein